jgi:hypothetical protein
MRQYAIESPADRALWRPAFFTPDQSQELGKRLLATGLEMRERSTEELVEQQVRTEELAIEGKRSNTIDARRLLPGMGLAVVFALHGDVNPQFVSNGTKHRSLQRTLYLQCTHENRTSGLQEFQVGADYSTCYDASGTPLETSYKSDTYVATRLLDKGQNVALVSSRKDKQAPLVYGKPAYWRQSHLSESGQVFQHGGEQDMVEAVFVQASPLMPDLRQVLGRIEEANIAAPFDSQF